MKVGTRIGIDAISKARLGIGTIRRSSKSRSEKIFILGRSFWLIANKPSIYEIYKKVLARTFDKAKARLELKSYCS